MDHNSLLQFCTILYLACVAFLLCCYQYNKLVFGFIVFYDRILTAEKLPCNFFCCKEAFLFALDIHRWLQFFPQTD